MTKSKAEESSQAQLSKFREAAKQVGTDDSEEAFDRTLKKVAKPPSPGGKAAPK